MRNNLCIFGVGGSKQFAKNVCGFLDVELSQHTERYFDDGESYLKSDKNVRGCDVYVIASIYGDNERKIGEKFTNLLFFAGSLKDAGCKNLSIVCPYLGFARQDRKSESRAPITTKYVAKLLEAAGADRLLTIDIHNLSAMQNAFRIPTDNLEAKNLIVDYLCGGPEVEKCISNPLSDNSENLVVLAPDSGGVSRAKFLRNALSDKLKTNIDFAIFDKERISGSEVKGDKIIGNVDKKRVIILDDLIASGGTIKLCVQAVKKHGGEVLAVCATHGLFIGNAQSNLEGIQNLLITDTIPPFRLDQNTWKGRLHIISTARLFASAIRRTHEEGGSISDLLK